ncbi:MULTISPECIES: hypothetical protein [unclassified Streptomyces]|uniref:hypothetical protein n=1 Tax=unclassified Streptomyces TaxID=2593676 RepID=UPI00117D3B3A|nr:hypothetical protein [Streptomyces sp. IB201691-2A2]TRO61132.1 hypothetical protein E4K73_26395 [Streptomyces sp. IB201691-2A2]
MIDDGTGLLTIGRLSRSWASAWTTYAPEAATVLAELLGDADRAAVLERMVSASRAELARFRELPALVRGPSRCARTGRSSRGWSPR